MHHHRHAFQWIAGIICLFYSQFNYGQSSNGSVSVHKIIQSRTAAIVDSLISIRQDLHEHPEIGGEEIRTADQVAQYLLRLGLEVHSGIGGHGVIGILKGAKGGRRIAWRADMDALPLDAHSHGGSSNGAKHACGHDVHTTIALGIADVLSGLRDQLRGTVYFIFQPSEENYMGAQAMLADGLLEIVSPEEVYATHISPMPAGLVATKAAYLYADYQQVNITYDNPSKREEIVAFTKTLISNLQNVSPDSKFWDTRNLMDPNIGMGNPNTIFKDYVTVSNKFKVEESGGKLTISGYVSTSNKNKMDTIPQQLRQQIDQSVYSDQLVAITYDSDIFAYSAQRGNINNDKNLTDFTLQTINDVYGNPSALRLYGVIPDGRGDDFAYFQEEIPGVYFLLGGSNFNKGIIAMPHTPNFSVDEQCIQTGVNYFSSMILARVNAEN